MGTWFFHNAQRLHLDDLNHIIWSVLFLQQVSKALTAFLKREGGTVAIPCFGHS